MNPSGYIGSTGRNYDANRHPGVDPEEDEDNSDLDTETYSSPLEIGEES